MQVLYAHFYTFDRYLFSTGDSTNSRLNSILAITGLENRKIDSSQEITNDMLVPIDYSNLNERLEILRADSMQFLQNALKA